MDSLNEIEDLIQGYHNRLRATTSKFYRNIYHDIDWEDKLICIKGPKGVGKSTLMLQHIRDSFSNIDDVLFLSLDNLWFTNHSLYEVASCFYSHGGRYLFLDEVHHYKPWQIALKNIYDDCPEMHIVFSGSSLLQIESGIADLSRRVVEYPLSGLSFREYLELDAGMTLPAVRLEDLLQNHTGIAMSITQQTKDILVYFSHYLEHGYYPFYKEVKRGYTQRLQRVVNHILDVDYPAIEEVEISTIRKAKKMLMVLAEQVPQMPTMTDLYRELETDRNQGLKMLYALQRAGLLGLLSDQTKALKMLSRPDKILMDNPNLMYALGSKQDIGTIRESFFFNQLRYVARVNYPHKGDFMVNQTYLFEVGGKSKSFEQIKDEPNSFLAIDGIEIGSRNRIPLWMFGLLY